ncbi:efflux RND transporter periplasmic adaptor subunit [Mesorhizobium sp. CAU 1741]|uniref:efflux RND transporter periplasmic adaptor subunit n=1 Tax=Mesorhizobium sp. CAU 1741 TaxID=3140366 RepID=UPI00325BA01E
MSFWKQLTLSLVVLVAAAAAWLFLVPGAPQTLERWGIDWAAAAVPETGDADARGPGNPAAQQSAMVVTSPIRTETINDRLSAIGTGRALSSVQVTPFASGRLTEVLVESGSRVSAGDRIAMLDSDAEEIELDRARIALEDAEARMERIRALTTSNTATTVQLTEAELAVSNARLAVRDAELTLERRSILAPINGVVGILPVSAGNYVTTQSEIATIDDRSRIVVDFWVPERFATMIEIDQPVRAASVARPDETFDGRVTAIDNRVDAASRTLRVQASIENEGDRLRAGMSFQVEMAFPGDTFPAVDPLAIQWGSGGAFVWVVDDGKSRQVPVTIVQRNTDSVLVSGELDVSLTVVTEGVHSVREGADVRLLGSAGPEATPTPAAGS